MDLEDTPIEEESREQPTEGKENRPTEQPEAPPHNRQSDKTGEANKQQESDQESPNEPPRKKRNIDVDKLTIIDPSEFKMSNNTKRITGKFIDKFWQPLDDVNAKSFDNILNLALSKTLERLGSLDSEGNMNEKMKLANKILTNAWLNPSNLESFKSRLRVTKVPLPSTMFPNNKGTIKDVFNYDKVLERKQFLETCLSAELKQLQDLEKYYHETKMIYESDKKYLSELTRATNGKEAKLRHQMYTQREELGLDEEIKPDVDLNLATSGTSSSSFNPDKDEEIKPILESLQKHLETISANTEPMLVFNEELEMLLNMLS
ncbi:uncharacterized protein SPAPADRAFT_60779 [Spathaspora passalidarum NRRL Y-27907]|uniref:Uncharacterized protein n=1 Tax=Spathaspora passalidarum (strain NRRL Y-27907 / 11-Y1) TaxID=619300 RepID=G3AMC6_SPAPN|nr:uncharacterized protein SPAPADRAFT_60779 [Spathaspora passalidarum NRRL Y-27907]EGW33424.1 hypothetical protein SPAPADRAFT_60779 [Spathaspora passalidarum NRRL Y-27907]